MASFLELYTNKATGISYIKVTQLKGKLMGIEVDLGMVYFKLKWHHKLMLKLMRFSLEEGYMAVDDIPVAIGNIEDIKNKLPIFNNVDTTKAH